ncbi:arginase family protein [Pleomorphomonas sp. JP5]|uniref:arginase family protein n=1 Tax=Pleomorphomonas sp. JP5 TaxID=2942998 RepID=UPI002043E483|nr:arginase family protein [Pleomorphomonas sp. JP5]MCM5557424.1 arginase family protein [Pleomorphomonas sp. JP5]
MTDPTSFLGLPSHLAEGKPRAMIFGASHGSAYPGRPSRSATAAAAIRAASADEAPLIGHWDFDLGGPLFGDEPVSCVDIGDVATAAEDVAGNRAAIAAQTAEVLAESAIPILLGGDDSVVIPFLAGFAGYAEVRGPIWVLQIDAHIDWRDEILGERHGYSSPMRRASEMAHVEGIVQVGMRGVGSARAEEIEAARRFGSHLVTAREIHAAGVEAALRLIPEDARVVITLDCDGLDPGIMPGVAAPSPGGLTYTETIDLIAGVGRRAWIVGFDIVELAPDADVGNVSALTAARLVTNAIGAVVRQG